MILTLMNWYWKRVIWIENLILTLIKALLIILPIDIEIIEFILTLKNSYLNWSIDIDINKGFANCLPIDIESMNWYWHWKRFILIDELILILIKALLIVCQ